MKKLYVIGEDDSMPLLSVWIIVIVIVAVIGLLAQTPPERTHQSFVDNNSKTQYITIGGESKTTITPNH
jgi:hypothetical protein